MTDLDIYKARQELLYRVQGAIRISKDKLIHLEAKTGVDKSELSRISRGTCKSISFDRLVLVARSFGISVGISVGSCDPVHVHGGAMESNTSVPDIEYQTDDPEFDFYK